MIRMKNTCTFGVGKQLKTQFKVETDKRKTQRVKSTFTRQASTVVLVNPRSRLN